jgi:hypothetical protein
MAGSLTIMCMGGDSPAELPVADLLRETERKRLRALVEGDMELARSLHAADYELIPRVAGRSPRRNTWGASPRGP